MPEVAVPEEDIGGLLFDNDVGANMFRLQQIKDNTFGPGQGYTHFAVVNGHIAEDDTY